MDSPSDSSASAFPDTPSEIRVFSDFISPPFLCISIPDSLLGMQEFSDSISTPPEAKQECHPHGSTNRSQDLTSYNSLIQSPSYPIPSNFLHLRNPSISAPLWLCLCIASDWLSHLRNASPFNSFGFSLYYSGYILLTRYDPLINRRNSVFHDGFPAKCSGFDSSDNGTAWVPPPPLSAPLPRPIRFHFRSAPEPFPAVRSTLHLLFRDIGNVSRKRGIVTPLNRYILYKILTNFRLCPPPSDVFALPAYAPSGLESETPDHVPHTLQYVSPMSSGFTPIHPKLEAPDLFVGFLDEGLYSTPYLRSATAQSFSHVLHPLSIIRCPPCISRSLLPISVPELNTPDIRKPP
ncbi:hypothetical protein F4604DRAFT_1928766 [Suillus subluteus]|nr:hypothetical protein F4604DRAFT_1928766 [Suillus subluteus]